MKITKDITVWMNKEIQNNNNLFNNIGVYLFLGKHGHEKHHHHDEHHHKKGKNYKNWLNLKSIHERITFILISQRWKEGKPRERLRKERTLNSTIRHKHPCNSQSINCPFSHRFQWMIWQSKYFEYLWFPHLQYLLVLWTINRLSIRTVWFWNIKYRIEWKYK